MRPDGVIFVAPKGKFPASIIQGVKDCLVQQFVAQAPVERLDESVLLRLSWINVVPRNVVPVGPFRFADLRFRMAQLVNSVSLSLTIQLGFP